MLNNQVDVLVRKLNYLEKYLLQQSELRQKAENKLQEVNYKILWHLIRNTILYYNNVILKELILKSKLETEKLEIIAILTNLKLVNVRLTKENIELKELLIKNKYISNQQNTSCTPDMIVCKVVN